MTKNIYQNSVLDLYADAHCSSVNDSEFYIWIDSKVHPIGFSVISEDDAWQDAFYNLKKV